MHPSVEAACLSPAPTHRLVKIADEDYNCDLRKKWDLAAEDSSRHPSLLPKISTVIEDLGAEKASDPPPRRSKAVSVRKESRLRPSITTDRL